jgi:hypothetical protein
MLDPPPHAAATLPDPEWTALQAELKPAVRMTMPAPRAHALAARMGPRGVACAIGPTNKAGEVALYVARDAGRVAALVAAERRTLALAEGDEREKPADERLAGHAALGALLGYPSCCVDAFVARARTFDGPASPLRGAHEDSVQARAALANAARPRAELNSLFWPYRRHLVTFYPCAFDCPRALRYATALERELARRAPGATAELMRALTATVVLAEDGARVVVARDGRIAPPPCGPGACPRAIDEALAARLSESAPIRLDGGPRADGLLVIDFGAG